MGSELEQTGKGPDPTQARVGDGSLDYGQLGEISYDRSSHSWRCARTLNAAIPVKAHGSVDIYIPAQSSGTVNMDSLRATSKRSEDVRKLAAARPEFQPGLSAIETCLSEALLNPHGLTERSGDLLAFGSAKYANRSKNISGSVRNKSYPFVAIPTGSHNDKLCILKVTERRKGWGYRRAQFLRTMNLGNTVTGIWSGDGGSIRQVSVESNTDRSYTLLAVRTPISTHILRPIFHTGFIGVEPLHVLQTPPETNAECVDLVFNPWTPKQLAAVDSHGQFVVWNFHLGTKYSKVDTKVKGRMRRSDMIPKEGNTRIPDDGWRRLLWVGDSETFVLSSRSHLECWQLSGKFLGDENSLLVQQGFTSRIAETRKNPFRDDEFFVVTTTSIICLHIKLLGQHAAFEKVLSWTHHRDINDLSLRLSFFQGLQDLRILLYSRNDSLCTVYSLKHIKTQKHFLILQGAPCRCGWSGKSLLDIQFVKLSSRERQGTQRHHWSQKVNHWQAIALASDLSLSGCLFHERPSPLMKIRGRVLPATWLFEEQTAVSKPAESQSSDDFIVSDGSDDPYDGLDSTSVADIQIQRELHGAQAALQAANIEANEYILETLHQIAHEDRLDMAQFLNQLTGSRSATAQNKSTAFKSIISLAAKLPRVGDLDTAFASAASVEKLFRTPHPSANNYLIVSPLASASALGLSNFQSSDESMGMDFMYRRLLSIYSKPLSPHVRGKLRLSKENTVRQVAGAIFLAAAGIRGSLSAAEDFSSVDTRLSPQQARSSATLPPVIERDPLNNCANRLKSYTKVASMPPLPAHPETPGNDPVAEILAHWTLHSDPSQYSYRDTVSALTGESNISGSQMSAQTRQAIESQRRRAEALAEMRRDREARRDAKRRRLDPGASATQPDRGHALAASTQTQPESQSQRQDQSRPFERPRQAAGVVASQVEPGRHGGRGLLGLPERERRPRKKSGFN